MAHPEEHAVAVVAAAVAEEAVLPSDHAELQPQQRARLKAAALSCCRKYSCHRAASAAVRHTQIRQDVAEEERLDVEDGTVVRRIAHPAVHALGQAM